MSQNPQFIRTDKAIMQALISLMREKPFEKITVQDILNATPVTRATFYAHYHDKYEIVERMLEYFFSVKEAARTKVPSSAAKSQKLVQKTFLDNRELAEALLKIHTEKVDFRQAIANELEQEYLASTDSPNKKIEARIYAQALTQMHLSFLSEENPDFSTQHINQIFIAVTMKLLNLSGDQETRNFLNRKVSQK